MYIADTSRLKHGGGSNAQFEFEIDLENICSIDDKISSSEVQKLKTVALQNHCLAAVKGYIQNGWRNDKHSVSPAAGPYFNYRDELVTDNGIVLKGTRLAIPNEMRKDTLRQLHRSHMGIEATLRRARDTVFWLGINAAVRDFIEQCEACQSYRPAQQPDHFNSMRDLPNYGSKQQKISSCIEIKII